MAPHVLSSSALSSCTLASSRILDEETTASPARKPSLLRRLYIAILVSQTRRAQREIDRALRGGAPLQR